MSTTEIIDVTKRFGSTTALRSVSLTISDGEFVTIVGPSGCGKTTLLRLLAGFETPTAGEIRIDDRVVGAAGYALAPERRNIGMVFQAFALWPHLSVRSHIRFPLDHQPSLPQDLAGNPDQRIDEVLRIAGLQSLGNRMPHELSGGQRQRVGLARAIAPRPALLLMDEPLSALDAELREELRREIQTLHQLTEATIVYVTHDQSEALAMSDRVVVMRDGLIEQSGPPEEIYNRPQTEFVARFVGKANLFRGHWDDGVFRPSAGDGHTAWHGDSVAARFREVGVFPVRPEQLELTTDTDGFPAIVRNALFQGREMHYTLAVGEESVEVYTPVSRHHKVGEHVRVRHADTPNAGTETALARLPHLG